MFCKDVIRLGAELLEALDLRLEGVGLVCGGRALSQANHPPSMGVPSFGAVSIGCQSLT
jgi:hypothetical protein